jgi:hypothetical protein
MKQKIDRTLITLASISALASFLTVGCSHTVSHTERTHVSSTGRVTTTDSTIRENPDGSYSKSETKKTTNP